MESREKLFDYLKKAAADLQETRKRLRKLEAGKREPIAIVGMGCRFPGDVRTPDGLWDLVAAGTDAISEGPADRGWDALRQGGFVRGAAEFDPAFFGISPREALAMDPQQRLLLEVCWEALERAGIEPQSLLGSPAGVFVGTSHVGYGGAESEDTRSFALTGEATSVTSGRVAYVLGLEGPAVTVDTACSSSLVAVHLAGQALRAGECDLALAGGVTILSTPGAFMAFSRQDALASDGRCKAFSAAADGTVLAEGVGVLVLERLSDAWRHGHQVLAVVRGTAVNSDGASNGLTAPNGPSQQRVIRAALASARVSADQVDAVEAHGTGTVLGDPIEAQALIATYGQGRPEGRPLWLGSVKSNIGHAQCAAGVAGLIKMVLALRHGVLPPTLHADEPSPHIDWSAGTIRLLTEPVPWPPDGRPRRAGISSFGISGTNVHAIIEEAPARGDARSRDASAPPSLLAGADKPPPVLAGGMLVWLVSGRSAEGVAAQAGRLAAHVAARPELGAADVAWSLATTRTSFEHRAVVVGGDREELAAGLAAVAAGQPAAGVVTGMVEAGPGKVVFVFPGQGGQWPGMAAELAASCPVFAARLAECAAALARYVDWDLGEVLAGAEGAPGLDRVDVVQPALWAVMVALAAAWQAAGVTPDAVLGHSQGEIAAATVAGILSLEDGAQMVALRSRALTALAGRGGMLSVAEPADRVRQRIGPWGGRLSVAVVNGPAATVVAGEPAVLAELAAACEAGGVRIRTVRMGYAAHCAQVEAIREEILAAAAGITPGPAVAPMISVMTGEWLEGPELGAAYWYDSLRNPVEFDRAVRVLAGGGHQVFIEVSPHPVLTAAVTETLEDAAAHATAGGGLAAPVVTVTGTLRRDEGGPARFLASLAAAHVRGAGVDWAAVLPAGQTVELPTYAFQRQRYWPQSAAASAAGGGDGSAVEAGFWAAVEGGDTAGLAAALAVDVRERLDRVLPALAAWRRRERDRSVTGSWRYRVSWLPVPDQGPGVLAGTWLVVVPAGGELGGELTGALAARGATVRVAAVSPAELDGEVLARQVRAAGEVRGVVSLLGLAAGPLPGGPVPVQGLAGTLLLAQALAGTGGQARLWVLTRGAVAAGTGDAAPDPVQAMVWGLGQVAGLELPGVWGGLIDLPPVLDGRAAARVCAVLAGCGEDQVAIRAAGVLARRLAQAPPPAAGRWAPGGTVLVTGGTGAIGGHVARWAAGRGAPRVVLASRSGPAAPGAAALAANLAGRGCAAEVACCDMAERDQVAGLLGRAARGGPPLAAVMHTAGAGHGVPVRQMTVRSLATALTAKAAGAAYLDELTVGLEQFVLFSSVAATWGSSGEGGYAAANAYLDGLAQARRARGLPATSVAWGLWGGGGLGAAGGAQLLRLGMRPLDPGLAVQALAQEVDGQETLVTVADVDWARFTSVFTVRRGSPLISDLPAVRQVLAGAGGPGQAQTAVSGALARRLAGQPPAEQLRVLTGMVQGEAAAVLGYPSAEAVPAGRAFRDLGLDSVTAVELRDRLAATAGLRLAATLAFDYPTPVAVARYLRAGLLGGHEQGPAPAAAPAFGEPVAIVGMGCRYPGGADSPEGLWELLAAGTDAVTGFPADRGWDLPGPDGAWPARSGGFVADAAGFDAGFFSVSPREALTMDPQQRLLLEVCWETLERAGIDPVSLHGSRTGVFAGAAYSGYDAGAEAGEGYRLTGGAASVISGRVAYALGLEGPVVTVDTACSSSLVALHLACQALRAGECDLALAGGVMVLTGPEAFTQYSAQGGGVAAADGRCKAFSAAADGIGWAEGAGMVVLEPLSRARQAGHRVLAVVAGSAVNSDGASNGLTAPNGPSQQRVIRAALAAAGVSAAEVDVVEAHGTGTALGDPIEAQALMAAYGPGREQDRGLWLGSVKSNIGHTQAAAGVAGVIKMVLALRHGLLPPTLHAGEPTPHVDWDAGAVRLLTGPVPWPAGDRPRRAGVSAFGISGTNAHAIVAEPPAEEPVGDDAPAPAGPLVTGTLAWPVSGRTADALAAQAGRLAEWAKTRPGLDLADVAWSLATTRTAFEHRAVIIGEDRGGLAEGLAAVAAGEPAASVITGTAGAAAKTVFVFPGQGGQWTGMGCELAASCPVFADRLAQCAAALAPYTGWDLHQVLAGTDSAPGMDRIEILQPALWAVMVSLAAAWQAAGVVPDAVVGHSQGEVAAAAVAGILSLDDAARVIALRSRALRALVPRGGMLWVAEPAERVRERLGSWGGRLAVGAVNSPSATVVVGDLAARAELAAEYQTAGVRTRVVPAGVATHCAQAEAVREEVLEALAGITPRPAVIPMVTAMTGQWLDGPEVGPEYWYDSMRAPVDFQGAIQTLAATDHRVFIEASAHQVLTAAVTETLEDAAASRDITPPLVTGTLRRHDGGPARFLASLASAYVHGAAVNWAAVLDGGHRVVDLPTYAFQHQRYWVRPQAASAGDVTAAGLAAVDHPVLGAAVELAAGQGYLLTGRLSAQSQPWLAGHAAAGTVLVPGTAFVEMAGRAGDAAGCGQIEELRLHPPLVMPSDGAVLIQVAVSTPDQQGQRGIEIYARAADTAPGAPWTQHATGRLSPAVPAPAALAEEFTVWPPPDAEPVGVDELHEGLAANGYGQPSRELRAAWRRGQEIFAETALPEDAAGDAASFGLHPALLDAVLHAAGLAGAPGEPGRVMVPLTWTGVSLHASSAPLLRARLRPAGPGRLSLAAADAAGMPVISVRSVVLRPVPAEELAVAGDEVRQALFTAEWLPVPAPPPAPGRRWAVLGTGQPGLAAGLAAAGARVRAYPDLAALRAAAAAGAPVPEVVLACAAGGAGAGGAAQAARVAAGQVLGLVQDWLAGDWPGGVRLVLVTRGAVEAVPGEGVADLAGAAVCGLVRAAQAEHPGRLVLADLPVGGEDGLEILAAAVETGEPELSVRAATAYARRLARPVDGPRRLDATGPETPAAAPRQAGTVLVTGGTGMIGGLAAGHLADTGRAGALVLASRSGPAAPGAAELAAGLAGRGAPVQVTACDAADRAALTGLLARVPAGCPLTMVVHAAGVLDDGVIGSLTPERVEAVMRPKTDAAWHLHELTGEVDLDGFVLFSAAAATLGSAGQGGYAAANAFLDGLAFARRAAGRPAVSLAWGLWAGASAMSGHLGDDDLARLARGGMTALSAEQGLALLDAALARHEALLVPARLDVARLAARGAGGEAPPLLRHLARPSRRTAVGQATDTGQDGLRRQLAGLPAAERDRVLVDLVRRHAAAVLGHASPEAIEPGRAFKELGFDSLTAVELRNRLQAATGLQLPSTMVFDHPSPKVLADFLRAKLLGGQAVRAPAAALVPAVAGEPVAIVAMSCRYPGGADSPEELWELVATGTDAISELPADRGWDTEGMYHPDPDHQGTSYSKHGGFVADVAGFDAGFFGVSPREALAMDPQQRLMLEVCWEVLERAEIDPLSLRGSRTGVFVGAGHPGYGEGAPQPGVEGYLLTGSLGAVISGRVSYTMGLEGPAVTVDTACSSSLVALHLACQALRAGECDLALAGGVTVMATPVNFTEFSRQRGLAADGRCKAFGAGADGIGWGEGAGMVLVERLADARRHGHRVLAVVTGSATNQDGASNGLTAPSGPSQQRVIRAALASAGLTASQVDAVEAHGTGTTLGDPIEAQALLATYGQDRDENQPLWLGSVKSNIGHAQSAAGIAGVIKMVLALEHGLLPRTLHADEITPHVDWSEGEVRLLTEPVPWTANGHPRRAGVSAFGVSGTNAHVILEDPPAVDARPDEHPAPAVAGAVPWLVSGRSAAGLAAQAARLAAHVTAHPELDAVDVGWSLAATRSVFGHRAVVIGGDRTELVAGLGAVAKGQPAADVITGVVPARGAGRVVFVFPGQGAQWAGMGRELAAVCPVFAERLAECSAALAPHTGWDLAEVLAQTDGAPGLEAADVVQPALWAVMVSLAAAWQAAGVIPDAVVGHSQGEIAAATVAGILSLEDGAKVVALRSRALMALAGRGGMVSVAEPAAAVRDRIGPWGERLSVAAVNGPSATVVSGDLEALAGLAAECRAAGVRARTVPVDYASHSVQVEAIREEILQALAEVTPGPVAVPMISAMTGQWLDGLEAEAGYWYGSLRALVDFERAVRALAGSGHEMFVEVSPHPVLTAAVTETLEGTADGAAPVVTGTLRRDDGGPSRFLAALAEVHVQGVPVDWAAVMGGGRRVKLPTYAFQRQRYWLQPVQAAGDVSAAGLGAVGHPLLGAAVELAEDGGLVLTGRLSARGQPWLADHAVAGVVLVPGTAFLEMAMVAAAATERGQVEELMLETPLVLPADGALQVQVRVAEADEDGRRAVGVYARPEGTGGTWSRHASGRLAPAGMPAGLAGGFAVWPPPDAAPADIEGLHERLAAAGYGYGPSFRGLRAAWRRGDEVFAEAALPAGTAEEAGSFGLHPALLDAVLRVAGLAGVSGEPGQVMLPFAWTGVSLHAIGAAVLRARLRPEGPGTLSVTAADGTGAPVISAGSVVLRPTTMGQLQEAAQVGLGGALFGVEWVPVGDRQPGLEPSGDPDPAALARAIETGEPVPGLVLACAEDRDEPGDAAGTARAAVTRVLGLAQEWLAGEQRTGARLVVVTRGAVAAIPGEGVADLAGASVWGLVRSAQTENPGRLALIDLPAGGSPDAGAVAGLLGAALASGEPEVAVRNGSVYGRRLVRPADGLAPPDGGVPWRLEVTGAGTLDGLALVPCPAAAAALAPGQVRVAVRVAGLNFRDVLIGLGMYPGAGVPGAELAGVVLETGPEVGDLGAGDRVLGLADGAFAPVVVADARTLVPIPDGWSFARAASVPAAFMTAWYGLTDLAGARPGQKLLVHAAAGGVGMAAVALARHLGLEVFGTASPVKWATLAAMGLDETHIASSRDAGFAEKFLAATGGAGMDIVLNSLAGELTDASLRLLPRGGAFIEMSRTDLRDPGQVICDHPGVAYRAFELAEAGPARMGEILARVTGLLAGGELAFPPVAAWDVRRAPEAFRFMSQARHTGKLVLTIPPDPAAPRQPGTVLVTGGTGTLGGLVARHLAATGRARALLLASRSGPAAPGVATLAAGLAAQGTRVQVSVCDAAERAALTGLLAQVPPSYPLTGVIHAAGVLDDGVIGSLTPGRVDTVMRPKADAAWHLHKLTAGMDLREFMLFSGGAATFGSAGQGNYAAANAFLDGLATARRSAGWPAVSLDWGLWADVSAMTGHLTGIDHARVARAGMAALSADEGLALLDAALGRDEAVLVPVRMDMAGLRARIVRGGEEVPALWRALVRNVPASARGERAGPAGSGSAALRRELAGRPVAERDRMLLGMVRAHAAAVLGHGSAEAIEPRRAFSEIGFDSLTSVELRNRLSTATGLRLPATVAFDYPSPVVLAGMLAAELAGPAPAPAPAQAPTRVVAGDPVAIVAMACRFPGGADDPDGLWELLAAGTDAISGFPADREWDAEGVSGPDPDHAGTSYARRGGFVHDAAGFDAGFFGISPREALAMDPQQRMVLEVCWEALERAGIDPAALRGSRTGVFAGVAASGYGGGLPAELAGHLLTGTAGSVTSGRVAYVLGLEGPAVTVDTACSSSLVALHLAGQALRAGECDLALAGGVTVLASSAEFVGFSQQGGLAADGRCKAFSAAADGMGMGEGAGMVVLERLADARRAGHRVLAVMAGSAVNSDGASNGLTAPNGPSQQRVIRAALAAAGLIADQVDAVEAHGTGTALGDPVEVQALLAAYGPGRDAGRPLWLGSVKSNIGHAQCAAGVAGVIKMVLALRHGVLPRTLHADEPSPHVDWQAEPVRLLTEPVPWSANGRPRRAGVSSFGFSGTNAHVILAEAPPEDRPSDGGDGPPPVLVGGPVPWLVSARSAEGLAGQAGRLAEWTAARPGLDPADVAWSLAATRSVFEHRVVVIGARREELGAGLAAVAAGQPAPEVVSGTAGDAGKVVFVFPGQGGQWAGMGRELAASCPVFAERLAECAAALAPHTGWDLQAVLAGAPGAPGLGQVDVVQPALWAVMVALAAAWRAAGVVPDAVLGHSQGEIAAATVAGILSLEDGARMVALRSRALRVLAGRGGMLSVAEPADAVRQRLEPWGERLSVAVVNGPAATVVAGAPTVLAELATACRAEGVRTRVVPMDYAAHCAQAELIREEILAAAAGIIPGPARVPMISVMTGEWLDGPEAGAGYWYDSLRNPVEFDRAVRTLAGTGHQVFIEASPHPVLTPALTETLDDVTTGAGPAGPAPVVTGTLRREDGGAGRFLASLAGVHVRGVAVDWAAVLGGGKVVELPTYAFQHQRYWPRRRAVPGTGAAEMGLVAVGHPLLGAAVELAGGEGYLLTGRLSVAAQPWLADHAVGGTVLLPGTAFVEMALRAGAPAGCGQVEELTLEAPLVLPRDGAVRLQVAVGGADAVGGRPLSVYAGPAQAGPEAPWTRHASGRLAPAGPSGDGMAGKFVVWPPQDAEPVPVDGLYEELAAAGYGYGPSFRGLRAAWRRGQEVFAEVALPQETAGDAGSFGLHPALLDAALHVAGLAGVSGEPGHVVLPFTWTGVSLHAAGAPVLRVRLSRTGGGVSLAAADGTGAPVVSVDSLLLRPVAVGQLQETASKGLRDALFGVEWVPVPVSGEQPAGRLAVIGDARFELADPSRYTDLAALARAVEAGEPLPEAVLVRAGGGAGSEAEAARAETGRVLALLQEWLAGERFSAARLVVVTRGSVSVLPAEGAADLAGAAVWGLVRSAQAEDPGRVMLADLPMTAAGSEIELLAAALAGGEPELAIRNGTVYGRRLTRPVGELRPPAHGVPWRLEVTEPGMLDTLALVPCPAAAAPPGPGQVRIAVRAAGLSFRDVLIGLGMYPGAAEMGREIAGVVLQSGPGVANLAVGDRVLGLADGGFGPVVACDAQTLVPIPAGWSFAQAAAVPMAFATAWHALVDLAGAQAGQRVLVHAAAGGVGMAAVAIARRLGLEVFATASPAKWATLAALGLDAEHIASSRDAGFEPEFLAATGGAGLDVVLNALVGELTDASLRLLPTGGTFIELGRTDVRDPRRVAIDHPGVTYRAFEITEAGPERLGQILAQVTGLLAAGELALPPVAAWDVRRAREAFQFMIKARHTGKLVLTIPPDPAAPRPAGTALVTGGTGMLGGVVARHLAVTGRAVGVVLASRSGPAAPGVAAIAAELAASGSQAQVTACDAADRSALATLLARIPAASPLTTVMHAAGVIEDGVIGSLTPARVDAVMRPKADGAWNLHELTFDMDLEQFALFSSAAATFGSAGQGNYAAANAFLDGLASHRRSAGQPAVSLAWGLWAGDSAITGHVGEGWRARMSRGGVTEMSAEEGVALLDLAAARDEALLVPARLDMAGLRAHVARGEPLPLLWHGLIPPSGLVRPSAAGAADGLRRRLAGRSVADQDRMLRDLVRAHAAAVLGHASAEAVEARQPFTDIGFDSLTAVELRNRLTDAVGLRLPATLIFDYPTPAILAEYLREGLSPETGSDRDHDEEKIRGILTSISVSRLHDAGLIEVLLQLADSSENVMLKRGEEASIIDSLDTESLVRLAFDNEQNDS